MDQFDDVPGAADRLFFSPFCDLWPRSDAHTGHRPDTPRWEPAFCVLPVGTAPAGNVLPVRTAPTGNVLPVRTAPAGIAVPNADGGLW